MAGRALVVLLAALLAAQVVRNAVVAALAEGSPDIAARVWPDHPATQISLAMIKIGEAARERRPTPGDAFALIYDAATKAPLTPEPFLVRGVQTQLSGRAGLATESFIAAERRDPRSLPAHYFLAEAFLKSGHARRGIREVGALATLAPTGATSVAPYLALYAEDRSTWPQLRELFRSHPQLEDAALRALAVDVANADAVMALANRHRDATRTDWLPTLLNSLVTAGEYAKARSIWAAASRLRLPPGSTLYDAGFADAKAPPPFNWTLFSSTVGLSERQPGGRLHVIYYGQDSGLLARQLLLLPPGSYRLSMALSGDVARSRALTWSVRCDGSQPPLAAIPVDVAASRGWTFTVSRGCRAQWLELSGVSSDTARQSEIVISKLKLAAEPPNG